MKYKAFVLIIILGIVLMSSCKDEENYPSKEDTSTYTLVFEDNFDSLNTNHWNIYNSPGHVGNGLRRSAQFSIKDGILYCTAMMKDGVLHSGGMSSKHTQTYGRFEARVLCQPDSSEVMSGVILTWPKSDNWPIDGENDIYETGTRLRTSTSGWDTYIHYGEENNQSHYHHLSNPSEWHTVAMDWTPNEIRIYVDDVYAWSDKNPDHIPDVPHRLCIQYDAFGTSISEPSSLLVDWVKIYTIK